MPRVAVQLTDAQYAHIERLAEEAGVDDAEIIRGLIEIDMDGMLGKQTDGLIAGVLDRIQAVIDEARGKKAVLPQPTDEPTIKGIHWERDGYWRVRVSENGHRKHIGRFRDKQDAIDALHHHLARQSSP